ncbi:MAG: L-seryl-tRNA(Sec) selenium transferase [Candidatus Sericytochromatia bacterium]
MDNLRNIWSVNIVIEQYKKSFPNIYDKYRTLVHNIIKKEINLLRICVLSHNKSVPDLSNFVLSINNKLESIINSKITKIINATGVIINTNFGRSPISKNTLEHISLINSEYFNLEYDIDSSLRGSRQEHINYIIQELTGAESAFVINNNAASLFLVCNTFAKNKKVIASRGELIEIGDSFRLTDIIESSQAILKEVGTTNKTYIFDYINAIDENTSILLKSHTSNYKILGFTESVSSRDLALLSKEKKLISFEDIGSGYLFDLDIGELKNEPNAKDKITQGIDLVCFSGDKLLGSIQAGIIIGKKDLIEKIKKNPISRTMRIDKVSLSILERTLKTYLSEKEYIKDEIPILRMIDLSYENLYNRTKHLKEELKDLIESNIIDDFSQVGGGSLPTDRILTPVLSIKSKDISTNNLYNKLKNLEPSIIGLVKNDSIILNFRTVFEHQDKIILDSIIKIIKSKKQDT